MGWDRVGHTCNAVRCIKAVLIGYAALRRAVECVGADFVAALGVGRARLNSCCGGGCEGEASHCEEAEEVGGEHFGNYCSFRKELFSVLSRFVLLVSFVFVTWVSGLQRFCEVDCEE